MWETSCFSTPFIMCVFLPFSLLPSIPVPMQLVLLNESNVKVPISLKHVSKNPRFIMSTLFQKHSVASSYLSNIRASQLDCYFLKVLFEIDLFWRKEESEIAVNSFGNALEKCIYFLGLL